MEHLDRKQTFGRESASKNRLFGRLFFFSAMLLIGFWWFKDELGTDNSIGLEPTQSTLEIKVAKDEHSNPQYRTGYYADQIKLAEDYIDKQDYNTASDIYLRISAEGTRSGASKEEVAKADYEFSQLILRLGVAAHHNVDDPLKVSMEALWNAAFLGHNADAQYWLATLILRGEDRVLQRIPLYPDKQDAINYLKKAASQNHPSAILEIAGFTRKGTMGFLQDEEKADQLESSAFQIYNQRASLGDEEAFLKVAYMTEEGIGTSKDFFKAMLIFEGLASLGNQNAMVSLVSRYTSRTAISLGLQDPSRALYWQQELAILSPDTREITKLAKFFRAGTGVKQNPILAHALFNYATSTGDYATEAEEARDEIGDTLNSNELRKAQSIAKHCIAQGLRECLDIAGGLQKSPL